MSSPVHHVLLSLAIVAGLFALSGCENDDDLSDDSTLVIDDDRTTGATITVFIQLGSATPTSVTIDAGQSKVLTVAQGTYTIIFDDDGTGGVTAGDTRETGVVVETDRSTTVEYAGEDKSDVIPAHLQANG